MASTAASTKSTTAQVSPFTGRARWAVAGLFLTGTVLQAIEFVLENPLEDNDERVAYWADHTTRVGWSMAAGLLAVPFLIGGFASLVALCVRSSRRLAWTAAVFLTFAMVGLAAIHGLELGAYGLVRSGDRAAAVSVLEGEDLGPPGGVLFAMFLLGAALGVLVLVVAMWRSPLVPRAVPVLVLGFAVLDFALGYGLASHLVNVGAGLVVAWAIVTGYSRHPAGGHRLPRPRSAPAGRDVVSSRPEPAAPAASADGTAPPD